ncbi:DEHA2E21186p [Debaryomyces hansenii CBS767]|uniref:DEHA2E21186p n=1 Tax=Debaryomyces hansenii (strain ATCC 36239 / CBS 767 / BCRC 21394 / JCM 1990 / NBRC 0083 / IGC 2968) TaxID=284592 RepID=Q6BNJ5_DEBHA|nr:DEHA2E21186p [Debaryomyces hansenii CBS767]CAG88498.2 DEHA2E21186p [Debaryomyces hansenii CBS767]|eukprot:XP_460225.2 DEHA2E21186p [Debaryomyces hansenii CBS767]
MSIVVVSSKLLMNFCCKNNGYDFSREYGRMDGGLELQQMTWKSCSTVLLNSHKEETDRNETLVELDEGVDVSEIISLIGSCGTNSYIELFDSSLVCEEDQSDSTINDLDFKRDDIHVVPTVSSNTDLPTINISPPTPENKSMVCFRPRSGDKSYLTVPPKPIKGDYYGKQFWIKCGKMLTNSIPSCISKDLVIPNENVIQLLQEEEFKVCNINRTHYTRGANSPFTDLYSKFCYKHNKRFNKYIPYRTEFLRYSKDQRGEINLYSKCGLCPFCPCIVFKNMETVDYYDHLSLLHGITRHNSLVPNPRYFGLYKFVKDGVVYHHQGVTCTICGDVLKINNSKSLYNYMKHYRDKHS